MAKSKSGSSSFDSLSTGGKLLILVVILGFAGAVYYFAFHMGLSEEIEQAHADNGRLRNELAAADQRQQDYLRLTQELAAREGIDRANKRVLPEDAEIPAFLGDLNREAELSGLEIELVEPRPEETEPLYIRIPVAVRVSGKFHQLTKFFHNVSQLRRAINMANISLVDPRTNDADEVLLTVDTLATTFRRPSENAPAAPAGAAPAQQGGS